MTTVQPFTRLTSFDYAVGSGYLDVWVNPAQIAYLQPRRQSVTANDQHQLAGTLIYFQQEAGVLAVRESVADVVAALKAF